MSIPPTGNRMTITGMAIARFSGSKIEEGWQNFDALGMMQQLGVILAPGQSEEAPPPSRPG
jgi:predicted ester cyclase